MTEERFKRLLDAAQEMVDHINGEADVEPERIHFAGEPDPREIRKRMGLSRKDFAHVLGVPERTLESWEQGRRDPSGAAFRLLQIAQDYPDILMRYA